MVATICVSYRLIVYVVLCSILALRTVCILVDNFCNPKNGEGQSVEYTATRVIVQKDPLSYRIWTFQVRAPTFKHRLCYATDGQAEHIEEIHREHRKCTLFLILHSSFIIASCVQPRHEEKTFKTLLLTASLASNLSKFFESNSS